MIAVQRSPIMSSLSSPDNLYQSLLSDPDHDLCNDNDDDIQQLWWDDHVSQFPAQYYSLLSPTDYEELFDDDYDELFYDEDDAGVQEIALADCPSSQLKADDDPSQSSMQNFVLKQPAAAARKDAATWKYDAAASTIYHARRMCANYYYYHNHNHAPWMIDYAATDHAYTATNSRCYSAMDHAYTTFKKESEEDVKEKRLTPNSSCGIVRRQRGLRGKRVTPHPVPVHSYCSKL